MLLVIFLVVMVHILLLLGRIACGTIDCLLVLVYDGPTAELALMVLGGASETVYSRYSSLEWFSTELAEAFGSLHPC